MRIRINIGRVKIAMAARHMSVEEAVKQTGISRSSFDKILREGQCTAFMIGKIAKLLDIPVWELVVK